jgi:hypothetical protein
MWAIYMPKQKQIIVSLITISLVYVGVWFKNVEYIAFYHNPKFDAPPSTVPKPSVNYSTFSEATPMPNNNTNATPTPHVDTTTTTTTLRPTISLESACLNFTRALHSLEEKGQDKYIVFQCRLIDDCGGWGDRLAGLSGAVLLALRTQRKFRIEWFGLPAAFPLHFVNWTYSADGLAISHADRQFIDGTIIRGKSHIKVMHRPESPLPNARDVAILNTMDDDHYWNDISEKRYVLDEYRVVFFHGNRGASLEALEAVERAHGTFSMVYDDGASSSSASTAIGCYRCIWWTLLGPWTEFLNVELNMTPFASLSSLNDVLDQLRAPRTCSIGYALRINDRVPDAHLPTDVAGCLRTLLTAHCAPEQRKVLLFTSNSINVNREAYDTFHRGGEFDQVFTSREDEPERHINPKDFSVDFMQADAARMVLRATVLAIADWMLMASVDILVVRTDRSFLSGFSSSAALYSLGKQTLIDGSTCGRLFVPRLSSGRYSLLCPNCDDG